MFLCRMFMSVCLGEKKGKHALVGKRDISGYLVQVLH